MQRWRCSCWIWQGVSHVLFSLRSCRNLQAAACVSPPAAAICLALLQLQREVNFASLWPNTINASLQPSIAAASVEIYHISAAGWCFYRACNTAEELWVWNQSSSNRHGKKGLLVFAEANQCCSMIGSPDIPSTFLEMSLAQSSSILREQPLSLSGKRVVGSLVSWN